jgi:photosystem II stability/assembly factor-like uncharacterized protein
MRFDKEFVVVSALLAAVLGMGCGTAWAQTNARTSMGPEGGRIYLLAASPNVAGTVYAAATFGSLFKSTDGGASWNSVSAGLPGDEYGVNVGALAVDPNSPATVYAAVARGVLKSTDGGSNWEEADTGLQRLAVISLAIDPENSNTLYAATTECGPCYGTAVFKSIDAGATWKPAGAGLPLSCCVNVLALDPVRRNTIYAGDTDGIFKSTDGGASWARSSAGLGNGGHLDVISLAMDSRNPATLYAGTNSGLFKTNDGAKTWRESDSGLDSHLPGFYQVQVSSVVIDPQNASTLYAAIGDGIFKSIDAGISWNPISSALPESPGFSPIAGLLYTLSVDGLNPDTVYVGSEGGGGVFKSTDGGSSWSVMNSGMKASLVDSIAVDPQNSHTLYAELGRHLLKTADGGTSWSLADSGLPGSGLGPLAIDTLKPSNLYVAAWDPAFMSARIFKSTDGALNWNELDSQPDLSFAVALAVDPKNSGTLYLGTGGGVFKTTDGGASWQDTHAPAANVSALTFDPKDSRIIYALTETRNSAQVDDFQILTSVDGGLNWSESPSFNLPAQGKLSTVVGIAVDPQTPETLYAATTDWDGVAGAVWKSSDAGTSWQNVWPIGISYISAIIVDSQNAGTIYVASDVGLFRTTDGGSSWSAIDFGPRVYTLALDSQNPQTLYVGTAGSGVFAITFAP